MLSPAELEDIKNDYALSLQDLTFNSKPIINMLTTIAQENIVAARPIARALEEHIAKVSALFNVSFLPVTDKSTGTTRSQAASHVPARLDHQEHRPSLHAALRRQPVQDLHGRLHRR